MSTPEQSVVDRLTQMDAIVKARVFGPDGAQRSNVAPLPEEQLGGMFTAAAALPPPYDPLLLCYVYENSGSLQPNIAAYATNVESFGFRLEPSIDLKASDANQRIEDAILLERLFDGIDEEREVMPEEVEARRQKVEREARIERLNVEMFFRHCTVDGSSFTELREKTRIDLETTGNAYWEVIRNASGAITQLAHVPSITCRLMRADDKYTDVVVPQKISALSFRDQTVKRRFRRYVQVINGVETVFFKDFGDTRAVDSKTGVVYPNVPAMMAASRTAVAATEMIHFRIHSPRSPYGVPRWIGNMLAVLGSRASEEVNYLYFDNKGVPPLAILVSGGVLAKEAIGRIESYVNEHIKGRENYHSVLVLEAEAPQNTMNGRVRIELKPLNEAQEKDALFQNYKANNDESVGQSFRVPKILRGSTADINRATADASLEFAEKLVFQPERQRFDHVINSRLLAAMSVRYWEFTSNAPIVRDPVALSEMVDRLVKASVLTPEEGRELAQDIFNRVFAPIADKWVKYPPALLQAAGYKPESLQTPGQPAPGQQAFVGDASPADVTPPPNQAAPQPTGAEDIRARLDALKGALARVSEEKRSDVMETIEHLRSILPEAEPSSEQARRDVVVRVPNQIWDSWIGAPT